MRSLNAYIERTLVGTLSEGNDLWTFDYDPQWAASADGFDLAPGLPRTQLRHVDGGSTRPVQWYFDNLLPEERLRDAIAREAAIKGDDAFALLAWLGAESAGSLTLLEPNIAPAAEHGMQPLSDAELSSRIERLPRSTLTAGAPKRMSLAGAQHKLLVILRGEELFEPMGAMASTHILKPAHPDVQDYPASVVNEFVTMRLARAVGLDVPDVWLRYVPQPVYIVRRFDRRVAQVDNGGLQIERMHIIDACQLQNKARTFKYTGATLDTLATLAHATGNRAQTRLRLFRWLVFNIAVGNDDCHLKNLSFHVDSRGVRLADYYDLLATSVYNTRALAGEGANWPNGRLGIELPGAARFSELAGKNVVEAGQVLGLNKATSERVLKEITTRLIKAMEAEAAYIEKRHQAMPERAKRYAGGESLLMRALQSIVLPETTKRLAA